MSCTSLLFLSITLLILFLTLPHPTTPQSPPIWLLRAQIAPYCPSPHSNTTDACIASLFTSMTLSLPDTHYYTHTLRQIDGKALRRPVTIELELGPESNHSSLWKYPITHWKDIGNAQERFEIKEDCIMAQKYDTELCCITPERTFRRYIERETSQYELWRFGNHIAMHAVRIRFTLGELGASDSESWGMVLHEPGAVQVSEVHRVDSPSAVKRDLAIGAMQVVSSEVPRQFINSFWLLRDIRSHMQSREWSDLSAWYVVDLLDSQYPVIRLDMPASVYQITVQCHQSQNEILRFHENPDCLEDQFCEVRKFSPDRFFSVVRPHFFAGSIALQRSATPDVLTGKRSSFLSGYKKFDPVTIQLMIRGVEFAE